VTWLNLAFRLMYLPIGLFGVSIATATLPAVSRHVARHDTTAVRTTIADGLSLMLMLNVPATVGLIVLASPIVRVIFEHGAFRASDTMATASALGYYALGLVGYSVVRILSPSFYALGMNRTPVMVSIISVAVNVVLNLVLVRVLGYRGLALGTSLAALFNATMLLVLLRRHLDGLDEGRVLRALAKIVTASAIMGVTAYLVELALSEAVPGASVATQAIRLGITIGASLGVLAGAAYLLRIREFHDSLGLVLRKLGR
jgi:putative peptidoglycan lipid II flippase